MFEERLGDFVFDELFQQKSVHLNTADINVELRESQLSILNKFISDIWVRMFKKFLRIF